MSAPRWEIGFTPYFLEWSIGKRLAHDGGRILGVAWCLGPFALFRLDR